MNIPVAKEVQEVEVDQAVYAVPVFPDIINTDIVNTGHIYGYMIFSDNHKDRLKRINPGAHYRNIKKAVRQKWKSLTIEEKELYENMALQNKLQLQVQLQVQSQVQNVTRPVVPVVWKF